MSVKSGEITLNKPVIWQLCQTAQIVHLYSVVRHMEQKYPSRTAEDHTKQTFCNCGYIYAHKEKNMSITIAYYIGHICSVTVHIMIKLYKSAQLKQ